MNLDLLESTETSENNQNNQTYDYMVPLSKVDDIGTIDRIAAFEKTELLFGVYNKFKELMITNSYPKTDAEYFFADRDTPEEFSQQIKLFKPLTTKKQAQQMINFLSEEKNNRAISATNPWYMNLTLGIVNYLPLMAISPDKLSPTLNLLNYTKKLKDFSPFMSSVLQKMSFDFMQKGLFFGATTTAIDAATTTAISEFAKSYLYNYKPDDTLENVEFSAIGGLILGGAFGHFSDRKKIIANAFGENKFKPSIEVSLNPYSDKNLTPSNIEYGVNIDTLKMQSNIESIKLSPTAIPPKTTLINHLNYQTATPALRLTNSEDVDAFNFIAKITNGLANDKAAKKGLSYKFNASIEQASSFFSFQNDILNLHNEYIPKIRESYVKSGLNFNEELFNRDLMDGWAADTFNNPLIAEYVQKLKSLLVDHNLTDDLTYLPRHSYDLLTIKNNESDFLNDVSNALKTRAESKISFLTEKLSTKQLQLEKFNNMLSVKEKSAQRLAFAINRLERKSKYFKETATEQDINNLNSKLDFYKNKEKAILSNQLTTKKNILKITEQTNKLKKLIKERNLQITNAEIEAKQIFLDITEGEAIARLDTNNFNIYSNYIHERKIPFNDRQAAKWLTPSINRQFLSFASQKTKENAIVKAFNLPDRPVPYRFKDLPEIVSINKKIQFYIDEKNLPMQKYYEKLLDDAKNVYLTFMESPSTSGAMGKFASIAQGYNTITALGGFIRTQIVDTMTSQLYHGLKPLVRSIMSSLDFSNTQLKKMSRKDIMNLMGILHLDSQRALYDAKINLQEGYLNTIHQFVNKSKNNLHYLTGVSWVNQTHQTYVSQMHDYLLAQAIQKAHSLHLNKSPLTPKMNKVIKFWQANGFDLTDVNLVNEFNDLLNQHSYKKGYIYNSGAIKFNQNQKSIWRNALRSANGRVSSTQSKEYSFKFQMKHTPYSPLYNLLFQYKTWWNDLHSRYILANWYRGDAGNIMYTLTRSSLIGMATYMLFDAYKVKLYNSLPTTKEKREYATLPKIISGGLQLSGSPSIFGEAAAMINTVYPNPVLEPFGQNRYGSSVVSDFVKALKFGFDDEYNWDYGAAAKSIRRLTPFQNVWYYSPILDSFLNDLKNTSSASIKQNKKREALHKRASPIDLTNN